MAGASRELCKIAHPNDREARQIKADALRKTKDRSAHGLDRSAMRPRQRHRDPFLVQSLDWPILRDGDGEAGRSSNYLPPKNLTLSIIAGP